MIELRVAIADDELLARKRLVRLLEAMPGVTVVGVHEQAGDALAQLGREPIDVLVLDVQMPGMTGIEAHALVPEHGPFVIFATAHPEHAVEAFELGAVDYVLKPIEAARLAKAIDRARRHAQSRAARVPAPSQPAAPTRLPIQTRAGVLLLDPAEISHAEFDGNLVTIHRRSGEPLLCELSLQDLESRLPAELFERVHRRALLNLREVVLLAPQDTGGLLAVMRQGGRVPVSRQSARKLRRWLGIAKSSGDAGSGEG
jgi:two-component system, LytTR family, response regulator